MKSQGLYQNDPKKQITDERNSKRLLNPQL